MTIYKSSGVKFYSKFMKEFVSSFGKLAKDLNMAIGITFLEKYDPLSQLRARAYENMVGIATVILQRLMGLRTALLTLAQEIHLLLKLVNEKEFI